jgi:hypothetical protein
MKTKRLLLSLLAMATAVSSFALNAGEYAYTRAGRYKVLAANLVTNGDFSSGTNGWKNANGATLPADTFSVETATDGSHYLRVVAGGTGASIVKSDLMLEAGQTYLITYKVKGTADATAYALSGSNCQNFFVNADGSNSTTATGYAAVAVPEYYKNDWNTITYAYTPTEAGFLVMNFGNLLTDDCFSDFGVYQVSQVADNRVLQREIADATVLYNLTELANGKADLKSTLDEMATFSTESASEQSDYISGLHDELKRYLDANGADASSYFSNFNFDNITPKAASSVSGWTTGTRWGSAAANSDFTTVHGLQSIGVSYELGAGALHQTQYLPAGKYLYSVSANAWDYPSSKLSVVDYNKQITGIDMYINADSTEMTDLPTYGCKTYVKIVEVKDGETVDLGVCNTGKATSNQVQFDNNYIYYLGGTTEQIDAFVNAKKLADAQNALQVMTDSAKTVVAKNMYIFGKTVLNDSIALSEAVYQAQTDPVNSPAILTQQMNYMRAAIKAYYTLNAEYVQLKSDIDDCKSLVANEKYTEGKSDLQTAITTAETYYTAISADNRDSVALVKTDSALVVARKAFYVVNASYNTPGLLDVVNGTFEDSPTSKGGTVNGWDTASLNQNTKSGWQRLTGQDQFANGIAIQYGRNSSSHESKYLAQEVTLAHAGVYEFTCEAQAYNSTASKNKAANGVYFFIGQPGEYTAAKIDSVGIFSPYVNSVPTADRYTLRYIATAPCSVRFGIDAVNNLLATRILMSNAQVKYYGAYEQYLRDSVIAVSQPSKDSLLKEINTATNLKNNSRNKENAAAAVSAFTTAISKAQTVYDAEVTTLEALKNVNVAITDLLTAEEAYKVSGVWPASGEYFDLTKHIQNAALADSMSYWVSVNDTASIGESGYMTYYFSETSNLNYMKVHQQVSGMPQGKYQFLANATYRLAASSTFPQDSDMNALIAKYTANENFYVVANHDSLAMKGVLNGCEQDKWSEIISAWNYRHNHPTTILDSTNFVNTLVFNVAAADNNIIDLGISAKNVEATSLFWAKDFKLYFWGDEVVTGIENIATQNVSQTRNDNQVYSITGKLVRSNTTSLNGLDKGIYIMNGKKVIVK